jgi:hypothetical protein
MRIHTAATQQDIYRATADLPGVYAEITEHGSRTHAHAFELALEGNGSHASQWGTRDTQSATWDEWGVVMARIFAIDPDTRMGGSVKRPTYRDEEDFTWQTNGRFGAWDVTADGFVAGPMPADTHPVHRWDWQGLDATKRYAVAQCKKCSALKRWHIPERVAA